LIQKTGRGIDKMNPTAADLGGLKEFVKTTIGEGNQ
jgi:hypothetical protein